MREEPTGLERRWRQSQPGTKSREKAKRVALGFTGIWVGSQKQSWWGWGGLLKEITISYQISFSSSTREARIKGNENFRLLNAKFLQLIATCVAVREWVG